MITQQLKIRIRYCETDKMGFVHHSNYPRFMEEARMELFRKINLSYKEVEDSGVIFPVVSMNLKFLIPVFFDEIITIKTTLKRPANNKLLFHHEIVNQTGKTATTAEAILTFMDIKTRKPIRPPHEIISCILNYENFRV